MKHCTLCLKEDLETCERDGCIRKYLPIESCCNSAAKLTSLRAELAAKDAEVEKLKMVCGEVYQVIGFIWKHKEDEPMWSDDDLERVLDNLSDASNDNPISHDDLLPWPRQATTNPIAKTFHNP